MKSETLSVSEQSQPQLSRREMINLIWLGLLSFTFGTAFTWAERFFRLDDPNCLCPQKQGRESVAFGAENPPPEFKVWGPLLLGPGGVVHPILLERESPENHIHRERADHLLAQEVAEIRRWLETINDPEYTINNPKIHIYRILGLNGQEARFILITEIAPDQSSVKAYMALKEIKKDDLVPPYLVPPNRWKGNPTKLVPLVMIENARGEFLWGVDANKPGYTGPKAVLLPPLFVISPNGEKISFIPPPFSDIKNLGPIETANKADKVLAALMPVKRAPEPTPTPEPTPDPQAKLAEYLAMTPFRDLGSKSPLRVQILSKPNFQDLGFDMNSIGVSLITLLDFEKSPAGPLKWAVLGFSLGDKHYIFKAPASNCFSGVMEEIIKGDSHRISLTTVRNKPGASALSRLNTPGCEFWEDIQPSDLHSLESYFKGQKPEKSGQIYDLTGMGVITLIQLTPK